MSEISVQCKYMLRVNIRTPLKVIFDTKNIVGRLFRLSIQYVSQLLTVLNQKLNKTVILTCRISMCIENESTGKYICSHAPYTRFTSVYMVPIILVVVVSVFRFCTFCPGSETCTSWQPLSFQNAKNVLYVLFHENSPAPQ